MRLLAPNQGLRAQRRGKLQDSGETVAPGGFVPTWDQYADVPPLSNVLNDPEKNRFLLEYLARLPGQAFLTAPDRRLLEPAAGPDSAFYEVERGEVRPLDSAAFPAS